MKYWFKTSRDLIKCAPQWSRVLRPSKVTIQDCTMFNRTWHLLVSILSSAVLVFNQKLSRWCQWRRDKLRPIYSACLMSFISEWSALVSSTWNLPPATVSMPKWDWVPLLDSDAKNTRTSSVLAIVVGHVANERLSQTACSVVFVYKKEMKSAATSVGSAESIFVVLLDSKHKPARVAKARLCDGGTFHNMKNRLKNRLPISRVCSVPRKGGSACARPQSCMELVLM